MVGDQAVVKNDTERLSQLTMYMNLGTKECVQENFISNLFSCVYDTGKHLEGCYQNGKMSFGVMKNFYVCFSAYSIFSRINLYYLCNF